MNKPAPVLSLTPGLKPRPTATLMLCIVLSLVTSCATLSRSYSDLAADLLPSDGTVYMTVHPSILDKSTAEALALSVMPTLNKEQLSYISRIETLTACATSINANTSVYGLMQGNLPSLKFLIGLDRSKSWKKQGAYWYNAGARLYLSEPGPGVYYFGSTPPAAKPSANASRAETLMLLNDMLEASIAFSIRDVNTFLAGTFGMEDSEIPLVRMVCKIVKAENASDILYTFVFDNKDNARIYTPFCKTIVYVLSGLAYPPLKALKLIQQTQWTADDKGSLICTQKSLTDDDISFIVTRLANLLNGEGMKLQ